MSDKPAPAKDEATGRFLPGNNGGPGRPKGARVTLTEQFLADMLNAWEEKGSKAIDAMIAEKPGDFVKVVASILPKEATLNINDTSDLTDDELAERIRTLAAQLGPFLSDGIGNAAEGAEGEESAQQSSRLH